MIYLIDHDNPSGMEFCGLYCPIRNIAYVTLGQVRKHKLYTNEYYIYERLPRWVNPETGEVTPEELTWINFKLAYFRPEEIKKGVQYGTDSTYTEDSLEVLGNPLTTEEINALITELHLTYKDKKKRTNITIT